jgi:phosphatidylserine decarboxylase
MRIPLTKYGLPQVALFPLILLVLMTAVGFIALPAEPFWLIETFLAVLVVLVLSFFRDPKRTVHAEPSLLLSPADGVITDIETVEENEFISGMALRIGIFLSVFDVHINRYPCDGLVEKITYRKGRFLDARNSTAGKVNESNDIWLVRTQMPKDRLIVRQISGAIARRIVCRTGAGQKLAGGQKFGMIKFGSRTELYLPDRNNAKILVKKGEKVKAGLTALIRYE